MLSFEYFSTKDTNFGESEQSVEKGKVNFKRKNGQKKAQLP